MTKILKKASSDSSQAEMLALVIQVLQLVAQSGLVKAEVDRHAYFTSVIVFKADDTCSSRPLQASSLNDVVAMFEAEAEMPSNVMKDSVAE